MKYVKPLVVADDARAEGVFAASGADGSDCFTASAKVEDTIGNLHYVRVSGEHMGDHTSMSEKFVITFDREVTYGGDRGFGVKSVSPEKGTTLTLTTGQYMGKSNGSKPDSIGFGMFVVECDTVPTVVNCVGTCIH